MDGNCASTDAESRRRAESDVRSEAAPAHVSTGMLAAVRRATAVRHRRLEAAPLQTRLLADDYQLSEYRRMLALLYGFYGPLARATRAHVHTAEFAERMGDRVEQLRHDLLELGATGAELRSLPWCDRLPAIDTPDRALGCAYVLEGATLGGRVIFKHLARVFADRDDIPLRFFAGDGERTAERWRQFCSVLNADSTNVDELCDAACATFDALATWFAHSTGLPARARTSK